MGAGESGWRGVEDHEERWKQMICNNLRYVVRVEDQDEEESCSMLIFCLHSQFKNEKTL
jgi:hypothetical protein